MSVFPTVSDYHTPVWPASHAMARLRQNELRDRLLRIRQFLEQHTLDGLWLGRPDNLTWFSGGISPAKASIRLASRGGFLLSLQNNTLLLPHAAEEETLTEIARQINADVVHYDDADAGALSRLIEQRAARHRWGTDSPDTHPYLRNIEKDFAQLRTVLSPTEQYTYRALGRDMAHILHSIARRITAQQTEKEIAAEIANRCYQAGITPTALLVSADSGIRRYRHPSPRDNRVTRFAILVLTGRRGGMHIGLTRVVAVDHLPPRLEDKYRLANTLNAACMAHSTRDTTLEKALLTGTRVFENGPHPVDWRVRFRGDVLDYAPREFSGAISTKQPLRTYQAIAWSTAINGIQAEDTFLLLPDRNEILTTSEGWPVMEIELEDKTYFRPAILRL